LSSPDVRVESIPEIAFSKGVRGFCMHAVLYDGHITGLGSHAIDRDDGRNEAEGLIEHLVVTRMLALSDNSYSVIECQYFG